MEEKGMLNKEQAANVRKAAAMAGNLNEKAARLDLCP